MSHRMAFGPLGRRTFLALGVVAIGMGCAPQVDTGLARASTESPWIPFDFYNDNRIFLPIRVNGRQTTALLDSGAASTILDQTFATELGLELQGGGVAQGIGGAAALSFARGVEIEIDPSLTLTDMTLGVIDLGSVGRALGRPLPVILGREVFNDYVVDIDFPNRRIAFRRKAGFTPPAGATRLPVRTQGALYTVPISIEGGPEGYAVLDLGNSTPLLVSRAYAEAHRILSGRPLSTGVAGGVGGMLSQRTMTLAGVQVAGVTFTNVPGTVFDVEPQVMDESLIGNLGIPIISRFRAIADLSRGALFLVPDPASLSAPFARNRVGLYVVQTGDGLLVQHVAVGSPAERDGWREGDLITAINGQAIDATYRGSSLSRWRLGPAGSTVVLASAGRPDSQLTLTDYY